MDHIHVENQKFLLNKILSKYVARWHSKRTNWPQLFMQKFDLKKKIRQLAFVVGVNVFNVIVSFEVKF
jgi:hypothetical protein